MSVIRDPALDHLVRALRELGITDVRTDRHTRMLYATDASIYQVEPLAVVILDSVEQAPAVVRTCAEAGLPILPRGAGTALAGQSVNRAVILDFSARCRTIRSVSVEKRRARVEPGVVLDQLNAHLAPHGLMFGPDVATASHANLGGMIGNNSAGAYSILHGRTVEHVVAIDALLADGSRHEFREGSCMANEREFALVERLAEIVLPLREEIARRVPKIRRHVDGYNLDLLLAQLDASPPGTFDRVNLATLLCGSEGTLAVTLGAEVSLVDRPVTRGLAMVAFATVDAALEALGAILAQRPAAVEMIDEVIIETARLNREHAATVELLPRVNGRDPGAVLYVEHFGASRSEVESKLKAIASAAPDAPRLEYLDAESMRRAWHLRKAGEPLLHAIPGERKPVTFVEDTAVDPSRLRAFVHEFKAIVERHGTRAAYWAHASVGCLHIRPLINLRDERDRAAMVAIAKEVADLVMRHGGALSGEHGDGRVRTPLLERVLGPALCDAFRKVKRLFDPQGLLNPGNIVDSGTPLRILDHHRVKPIDRVIDAPLGDGVTFYRYEREGGFGHAIDQCNGAGLCRRMAPGAMCPSYRATLEERHATRGRGNALRLALTGQFGDGAPSWNDPETLDTLDLCLGCKACKSECPSNVDIAKLKSEYLAQAYRSSGGAPWAARLLGRLRMMSRAGSALAPLSNLIAAIPAAHRALFSMLRFDPRREPLTFSRSLARALRRHACRRVPTDGPVVLLMGDCFSCFQNSEIGLAAVKVLEAFGYRVELIDAGCCARPQISLGLLDQAVRTSTVTALHLEAALERHPEAPLLTLEPSCDSAMRDDWTDLQLGLDSERVKAIAARTMLVDEFLARAWEHHPRRPSIEPKGERILVHTHCHQRALHGSASSAALLERLFPGAVEVLDSGCCGMAGSFGYSAHRFDLSMRIGEISLFAPLRRALADSATRGEVPGTEQRACGDSQSVVVAAGTSCRQQLREGMGVGALHPIDLCARALANQVPSPS
ncbi:MAG: FAD-binding protein [Phycisphaeraceae bacterium]|nr:FAD-binding protein [Phycisphaeraceae bacterium]